MAERTLTLTIAHVRDLADRFYARGTSAFGGGGSRSERNDLVTGARLLRYFTAEYGSPESTITIPAEE